MTTIHASGHTDRHGNDALVLWDDDDPDAVIHTTNAERLDEWC